MPDRNDLTGLATEVANRAREAAYVAVGLGVLGLQRAQVQRQEWAKHTGDVDERVARVRKAVAAGVEQLDEWFDATVQFLESSFEPLEAQLPPTARDMAGRAKEQVRELRSQLRQLVSPGS